MSRKLLPHKKRGKSPFRRAHYAKYHGQTIDKLKKYSIIDIWYT